MTDSLVSDFSCCCYPPSFTLPVEVGIKISFQGEIRRSRCLLSSFIDIAEIAFGLFRLGKDEAALIGEKYDLLYLDDEGDWIKMSTDSELKEALFLTLRSKSSTSILRIKLELCNTIADDEDLFPSLSSPRTSSLAPSSSTKMQEDFDLNPEVVVLDNQGRRNSRLVRFPSSSSSSSDQQQQRGGRKKHNGEMESKEKDLKDSRYNAAIVCDIDVGRLACEEMFSKIWKVRNSGTCEWPIGTAMVLSSKCNVHLGSTCSMQLSHPVLPGHVVEVVAFLRAPSDPANYKSYWRMQLPNKTRFGPRINFDFEVRPAHDDGGPAMLSRTEDSTTASEDGDYLMIATTTTTAPPPYNAALTMPIELHHTSPPPTAPPFHSME